jgi:hypothetical protein
MNKYQYTDNCAGIYSTQEDREQMCRKMTIAGMEWLDEHPDANIRINALGETNESIFRHPTDDVEKLKDAISDIKRKSYTHEEEDARAAKIRKADTNHMATYAASFAIHAKRIGWNAYIQEIEQATEEERELERASKISKQQNNKQL